MAGRLSLPEEDLTCPICCAIFRDPVVLKCTHSFCAPCLQQYWTGRGRRRDCPLCRTQNLDDPVPSLTLKNLCESCVQEESLPVEETGGELYCDPGEMCPAHNEKLKLYCLLDKEPICVVCHTSRKHKQHDCCPISEAVLDVKEKMKTAISSLQEKREAFDKMKKNCEDTVTHIQVQARFVERRTHEEFEKLHNFLHVEEESRMEMLRREEEQKTGQMRQMMEEIERSISSMSETIRVLEEEMALEDLSVLHKCKRTLARANVPVEEPVMAPAALIDVAKYVGSLTFQVWEKMHKIAKYTPVTLDPNTAAPWLVLSDDLTTVHDSDEKQRLPNNPERFDPDTAVLGRNGLTSGKHAWEVNVGDNTAWVVGVAKEFIKRKEKVSSVLNNGYLCVYFYHKMYFAGTSPLTRLNLKRNPQRIRVQLDCEKGKVSFYDPHNNTHIYTFKHTITEAVFPYLWVGCQKCPLTVEPVDVFLKLADFC
ncbi:tripartite motif-containing protein 35 [Xiphophorus couchianus]|uniref:tripartite motif-containing protein 35 n=1 Tax=Xiphophorus couchianus TaxID=32473 RepID=UPI001016C9BA|nr:tripartite motif-containing protein 35-like [Xiphophorus couchianus]XP_027900243.1 tripartite motif-containing protein 35-like [Xiphophorus couchianus]